MSYDNSMSGSTLNWRAFNSIAAMGLALLVASVARTETQVAIYGTLLVLVLAGISGGRLTTLQEYLLTKTANLIPAFDFGLGW